MTNLAPTAKIAWRRPVITDMPKSRPTAEQADARHQEIKKHWRKQRKRRGEEQPSKPEDVRLAHLRWRELQRLMRHRYGVVMPDTLEGRRDLEILIGYATMTGKKVQHIVEIWAPWLGEDEADHIAAHQHPVLHKADDLAHKLDLTYFDRQKLAIHTIVNVDVDKADRDRRRLERRNVAKRRNRAAAAKQQEENPVRTHTAENLPPKAKKVLARIDGAEIAVPELTRRLANLKEFKKLSDPQRQVHKIVDHLIALGLVTDRYAPGQARPVRHVSRPQQ
jgi:hypothetical protein